MMLRRILAIGGVAVLCGMLAACAGGGQTGFLSPLDEAARPQRTRTIFAVTTRRPADATEPGHMFSGRRDGAVRIVSLTMSMPPDRAPGTIPASTGKPDPEKHIALVARRDITPAEFNALLRTPAFRGQRALVFTHGFNTKFDDAVVRFSQIVEDTGFNGVPILFSWPSRGSATDYGYDKDSANFSRDAMGELLTGLSRERNISGVEIFAHSMGNWLTLETLRQIAIARDTRTLDRINRIVLAAPDVDMEVFRTQVAHLGSLRSRIVLYASSDDHALQLSRRLFGGSLRAGQNTDLDEFRRLGITAHDLSGVAGGMGKNHGKAFGDPETISGIGKVLAEGGTRRQSDPVGHGLTDLVHGVHNAVGSILPGGH
jgi:esterase/lipase superfamily enzyme